MTRGLQRVKDPTGRVDWLVANLLKRAVEQRKDPALSAVYEKFKAPVEEFLRAKLGPRNRHLKNLKKYILEGNRMLDQRKIG